MDTEVIEGNLVFINKKVMNDPIVSKMKSVIFESIPTSWRMLSLTHSLNIRSPRFPPNLLNRIENIFFLSVYIERLFIH